MIYSKAKLKWKFQEDKYHVQRDPCSRFIVLNIQQRKPVHNVLSQKKITGSVQNIGVSGGGHRVHCGRREKKSSTA